MFGIHFVLVKKSKSSLLLRMSKPEKGSHSQPNDRQNMDSLQKPTLFFRSRDKGQHHPGEKKNRKSFKKFGNPQTQEKELGKAGY